MPLADTFQAVLDALPEDWTDIDLDLRIFDERRYVEAALLLAVIGPRPYSRNDWHWRVLVAHRFGHAAAVDAVRGALRLLDEVGIEGEIAIRDVRSGRVPVNPQWGRPESVRRELRRLHAQ